MQVPLATIDEYCVPLVKKKTTTTKKTIIITSRSAQGFKTTET